MRLPVRRAVVAATFLLPSLLACNLDFGVEGEGEGGGEGEGEGEGVCDVDGDGIDCSFDCDDDDAAAGSNADDADCDGVSTFEDCNDFDPDVAVANVNDADCDGVSIDDDCNDNDLFVGDRAEDADCDGFLTGDDCDDADPISSDRISDADCDGVTNFNDCDDTDPAVGATFGDNDCDGVPSGDDCNDFDPNVGRNDTDADCDGFSNADELACDSDPNNAFIVPGDIDADGTCDGNDNDADGDGSFAPADCDDRNAAVRPGAAEIDLDGLDNNCDGNFGRDVTRLPELTTGGEYAVFATTGSRHFVARIGSIDVFDGPLTAPVLTGAIDIDRTGALAVLGDKLYVLDFDLNFNRSVKVIDTATLAIEQSTSQNIDGLQVSNGRLLDSRCTRLFTLDGGGLITGSREIVEAGATCVVVGDNVAAVVGDDFVVVNSASEATAPLPLPSSQGFGRTLVADGDVVYVITFDSVVAVGISGASPLILDTITEEQSVPVGGFNGLLIGDTLVVVGGNSTLFLDVSNPAALALSGTDNGIANPSLVVGTTLFQVNFGNIFKSEVTATTASDSVVVPNIVSHAVSSVFLDDGHVYLGDDDAFSSAIEAHTEATLGGAFAPASIVSTGLRQPRTLDQATTPFFDAIFNTAALVAFDGDSTPSSVTPLDGAFGNLIGAAVNASGTTAVTVVSFFDDTTIATWDISGAIAVHQGDVVLTQPTNGFAFLGDVRVFIDANRDVVAFPDATATELGAGVELATIGTPRLIMSRGDVLYHATDEGFFGARVVADVDAPGAVSGGESCEFPNGMTLGAGRAYVVGGSCLSILSIESPAAPVHVVDVALDGFASGAVSVDGDLIGYLADGTARFLRDGT